MTTLPRPGTPGRTGASARPEARMRLDPGLTVVARPPHSVQLGLDPDRAVIIDIPASVPLGTGVEFFRWLQRPRTQPEIDGCAAGYGLAPSFAAVAPELRAAGLWEEISPHPAALGVLVYGSGPLSAALIAGLPRAIETSHAAHRAGVKLVPSPPDLVLLTDSLIADPRLVQTLMEARVPHLPVRLRDGIGIVGPLVLPGTTLCLECLDYIRTDGDPWWPAVALQLIGRNGNADRSTVAATAAVAIAQVERILAARIAGAGGAGPDLLAPETLDTTLEISTHPCEISARTWRPHPRCGCRS